MSAPAAIAGLNGAIVYAVSLEVDAQIAEDYLRWLRAHMREIAALPGFTGARLYRQTEPAAAADRVALCVHYTLRDAAALDDYLRDHAPRLRADGEMRFGGRFRAARQVLRQIDTA